MNLANIQTAHFPQILRGSLLAGYPRTAELDYGEIFRTVTHRAAQLWREQLVPEFGVTEAAAFEKALWRVRMLPASAIPWPMGFGYAYGAACHALAGGSETGRGEAATTTALGMFLIGLFDHLLDRYPREFGNIAALVTNDALRRYTLERDLSGFVGNPDQPVGGGMVNLYRLYFIRCHRLLGPEKNSPLARQWYETLAQVHDAERASVDLRISTVPPSPELIEASESPGTYSSWLAALSACLGLNEAAVSKMEPFAREFTRLSRLVDSVIDVNDDIGQDRWGGLAVRLALIEDGQASADGVVLEIGEQCVDLLTRLRASPVAEMRWQPEDRFSLLDVMWAYVWSWSGGETPGWQQPIPGAPVVTGQ